MDDKPRELEVARLRVDHKNPRIPKEAAGQREALRALAEHLNDKLVVLADHIVTFHRLNPSELPIIMQSEEEPKFWTVLEGNRRLTALRALETGHWRLPISFIEDVLPQIGPKAFSLFDPPYIEKGKGLYLNNYSVEDHPPISPPIRAPQQPHPTTPP